MLLCLDSVIVINLNFHSSNAGSKNLSLKPARFGSNSQKKSQDEIITDSDLSSSQFQFKTFNNLCIASFQSWSLHIHYVAYENVFNSV